VELDVRSPEGRVLVQRLICAEGDGPAVFLTNLAVDGELSYAALSKIRPDLIMVQLTGSPDGSNAVDYTVNCAAGFPGITGSGQGGPVNHVLPAWDVVAGGMLALAVVTAERQWRLSGQGQHVKLALSDVAMATAANLGYLADVEVNGTARSADGNFLYGAYGDSFVCADGRHVMVVAITDRQWSALLRAMGLQAALEAAAAALGHRLDSEAARYAARELISTALRPWFAARGLADVAAAFTDRSILWGPYRNFAQMLAEDPRCSEANPMFRRTEHPGVGSFLTARSPLSFASTDTLPAGIAPALGAHTRTVLAERLGLDHGALDALALRGAVGGA
jgi:2-methylfumaryl-CoA isomerase